MSLHFKTNFGKYDENKPSPQDKQKVLFACHPDDFETWFDVISNELLIRQDNCAVCYYDATDNIDEKTISEDLPKLVLIVIPVSEKTLRVDYDIKKYINYAFSKGIRLLLIQVSPGIESGFNDKYGNYQLLNRCSEDKTERSYKEKLNEFLDSAIIGEEQVKEIQQAFDAYIFLSYRKKDRKYANELMSLIHSNPLCRDIAIWYDEYLVSGEEFNDTIQNALVKSNLVALLVTPNLLEISPDGKKNYVMDKEYPCAKETGKPIFPVEAVKTNSKKLNEFYSGIPHSTAMNDSHFNDRLINCFKNIKEISLRKNDNDPKHNYLIGLAYLNGIYVNKNHETAIELIIGAAEAGFKEAEERMYNEILNYYNMGLYPLGVALCERLKPIIDKMDDEKKANWYKLSGLLYCADNNLDGAESVLKDAWDIHQKMLERKNEKYSLDYAEVSSLLAETYFKRCHNQEKAIEAEKYLKKALKAYVYLNEKSNKYLAQKAGILNSLATLYAKTNQKKKRADEMFQESIKTYRDLAENESRLGCWPLLATGLNNYAVFLMEQEKGKDKVIENSLEEALNIRRWLEKNISESAYGPRVALTCKWLGTFHSKSNPEKAENFFKESIEKLQYYAKTISKQAYEPKLGTTYLSFFKHLCDNCNYKNSCVFFKPGYELKNKYNGQYKMIKKVCKNRKAKLLINEMQRIDNKYKDLVLGSQ